MCVPLPLPKASQSFDRSEIHFQVALSIVIWYQMGTNMQYISIVSLREYICQGRRINCNSLLAQFVIFKNANVT
jgi:hypothetical protein